ncbi:MAG: ATP-dependent Clp protease proteolytic subunit [Chlamydiae bacterium]|nr:ATP-dependent Clp protease proteolytic subunit [Chlamydiota bacterium]
MRIIPNVIEETAKGERHMDIFSRLLSDRIIFLGTEIDDQIANLVIAQMIFLQSMDSKKPVNLYINSPGGVISSGLAIYDTMQYLECEVHTYCIGMAASMAALLLCAGTKGKRFALPNSRIMIHQPHGGVGGTSADIERQAQEILRLKQTLSKLISFHTNQPLERIIEDSDRDFYLSAEEARVYGIVDQVVHSKKNVPKV